MATSSDKAIVRFFKETSKDCWLFLAFIGPFSNPLISSLKWMNQVKTWIFDQLKAAIFQCTLDGRKIFAIKKIIPVLKRSKRYFQNSFKTRPKLLLPSRNRIACWSGEKR